MNKLKFNDDSTEEKILINHWVSNALFIDTKVSKKEKEKWKKKEERGKKTKICNEKIFLRKRKMQVLSQRVFFINLSYHQSFSISLLDLFKFWRNQRDGNCLFRAQCKLAFGDDSFHLLVRQIVWDYMIKIRDLFEQYMEEDTTIDQYISKILLDGKWGRHAEYCCLLWDIWCSNTNVWSISRLTPYS